MNYTVNEVLQMNRLLAHCCKVIHTHTHSSLTGKHNGQMLLFLGIVILTSICDKTGDFFRGTPDRTMCPEVDSASESECQGFLLG